MPVDLKRAVQRALAAQGVSASRAALEAGLPRRAIQNVLDGRQPSPRRVAQICAALGIEFYIGPPRTEPPTASWPQLVQRLEEAAAIAEGLEVQGARLSDSSEHDLQVHMDCAHSLMRVIVACEKLRAPVPL